MSSIKTLTNGLLRENPLLVLLLGLCPALGTTTTATTALFMGIATAGVLIVATLLCSLVKRLMPSSVRIPIYLIIISMLVSIVQLVMQLYFPTINEQLGIFVPLIAVNSLILLRIEQFSTRNSIGLALLDGIGMGIGFILALLLIGCIRELLGMGSLFNYPVLHDTYSVLIFALTPGAFLVIGYLAAMTRILNGVSSIKRDVIVNEKK